MATIRCKVHRRGAAWLAALLLLGGCSKPHDTPASGTSTPSAPTVSGAQAVDSQKVLDSAVKATEPGCSAAVGIEGRVAWTGVAGLANLSNKAKITADTVFDIASVSKQFTATSILLLVQAGKLTLDDPLSRYLTEMPPWAANVSLAQLMHHTSGLPDYSNLLQEQGFGFSDRTTESQALQVLAAAPELTFKPGSRYEYNNSNYLLLSEIVHRVSGRSLADFIGSEIFRPLGLTMVLEPVAAVPNKATGYLKGDNGYQVADFKWEQVGDRGIQTTLSQLVRWADNYRTGKVGGQKLLEAQLAGAVETEPGGSDRYGAGIQSLSNGMLDHPGTWAGFLTSFRISSDRRTAIAVSCDVDSQDPGAMVEALGSIWMPG